MNFRTDLALERREYIKEKDPDGIIFNEEEENAVKITTIKIINENGERLLGKPKGSYITVEANSFMKNPVLSDFTINVLSEKIKELLPSCRSVLVAGLGNEDITSDALGPKSASLILATRHLKGEMEKALSLPSLKSVSVLVPGVLGKTGIETAEIIKGVINNTKPDAVIVIDALAARSLSRLGNTVQMCNTGIFPGSGVGNRRGEISQRTMGVPVVSIGVPTVVDGLTMALDVLQKTGKYENGEETERLTSENTVMVTPKEIDLVIERASLLVAMGINLALQEKMSAKDIFELVR